ncbi:MAG: type I restriction enzyme HsdR N-terminal domain-containing protein [Bacteroidales bacterium]|nr:type I restriction enzyme HsdR N-terminal domain-containing protein [Bacteroidales bacterium]
MSDLQWFKTTTQGDKTLVFDPLRKRYCTLTPEEEVRQKALFMLVEHLDVPPGLLAVEYSIKVNGLDKRCDAVVFGRDGNPLMILECKASSVKLAQDTLEQALRYYSALHPKFLMLYNGSDCYCFKIEDGKLKALDHLPTFQELSA